MQNLLCASSFSNKTCGSYNSREANLLFYCPILSPDWCYRHPPVGCLGNAGALPPPCLLCCCCPPGASGQLQAMGRHLQGMHRWKSAWVWPDVPGLVGSGQLEVVFFQCRTRKIQKQQQHQRQQILTTNHRLVAKMHLNFFFCKRDLGKKFFLNKIQSLYGHT